MHSFLAIDTSLIPEQTKENTNYNEGEFSNDGALLLLDGYDEKNNLVHPQSTFDSWLQWSENPEEIQSQIIGTATKYTLDDLIKERQDPDSIWYKG